jgi:N-acylneuraminate cytidylyltransferase
MEYLIQGYNKIITNKYDAIYPVCQFNYPIQRAFHLNSDCILKYREKNHTRSRSQDLEEFYHDTGTWYWMKTSSFIKSNSIFGEKTYGIKIPEIFIQDIDNLEDWRMAEFKYNYLKSLNLI